MCCGTSKRGHFCKKMGGQVCESVSCSACDLDVFGILVFGPQTRNLHPGGSARGGLESGEWQCRGPEGGGTEGERRGGARMGCLSFALSLSPSPLRLLLPFSLPLHVFSCSSCLSAHSLSQGHTGRRFKGPLLYASSAGTSEASERDVPVRGGLRQETYLT